MTTDYCPARSAGGLSCSLPVGHKRIYDGRMLWDHYNQHLGRHFDTPRSLGGEMKILSSAAPGMTFNAEMWKANQAPAIDAASTIMLCSYVELLAALSEQSRITWADDDGGILHRGTLRGTYRYNAMGTQMAWATPLTQAHIHITTVDGAEVFMPFLDLWERHVRGYAQVGHIVS